MRRLFPYLLIFAAMATACASRQDDVTSAAMDIYSQYADHSQSLTVAFVGDFDADGRTYNAVMFQTDDSTEWEWLQQEFGVINPSFLPQGAMLADPSMLAALPADGQTLPADGQPHGVVMGSIAIDTTRDFADTAEFLAYMDSLVKAMLGDQAAGIQTSTLMVFNDDSMLAHADDLMKPHQRMNRFSRDHGEAGYLVNADYTHQTLWLFFFGSPEEEQALIKRQNQKILRTTN